MARSHRELIEHGRCDRADQVSGEVPAWMILRTAAGELNISAAGEAEAAERTGLVVGVVDPAPEQAVLVVELVVDA